jgi:hypothetical protein
MEHLTRSETKLIIEGLNSVWERMRTDTSIDLPADLFAWGPLLRDFGDYGATMALHKLGRISACDTRVAIAELATRA